MKKIITLFLLAFIGTTTLNAQCFKKVAASGVYSVAIKTDGTLWACGTNQYGQFGNGTMAPMPTTTFTQIGTATDWADIFCCSSSTNGNHTLGLKTDGTLYAWGDNTYGQLGIGNPTGSNSSPVQVSLPFGKLVKSISLGGTYSLALMTDGTVYAWGLNSSGQLGIGSTSTQYYPVKVNLPIGKIAASIAAGGSYALAIMTDGTMYAWGNNGSGQLGDGTTTYQYSPVKVSLPIGKSASIVTAGSGNTYAIMTDGTTYAWGANSGGQLGIGNTINQSTPTQVTLPTGKSIRNMIAGFGYALATMTDGSLYTWGSNTNGQLGIGNTTNQTTPTLVSNIIASSNNGSVGASAHSIVITTDGRVYSWGLNTVGQMGYGNTNSQNSPVQISSSCVTCTPTTSTFTVSACNSYTWAAKGNKVYTASNNTDTIHLTNAGGCDSLVTLNLTIKTTSSSTTNVTICPNQLPYSWNGTSYNTVGSYVAHLTNAAGCDSAATLVLSTPKPFGNALNFDGIDDAVAAGTSISSVSDFTWEAWIKTSTNGTIISKSPLSGNWAPGGKTLFVSNGIISFDIGWIGVLETPNSYNDNSWHHVALTAQKNISSNNDLVNIYVDGVLAATKSDWDIDTYSEAGLYTKIGFTNDNFPSPSYFSGTIDEVRIWSTVKTQAALMASMNNELVGNESNLVEYYNFNQGVAGDNNSGITTLLNNTTSGHNGTLNNFTLSGSTSNWVSNTNLTVASGLPAITGASSVCVGSTTTLSNAIAGGVWFTQATSQATINAATGLLTAKNAGTITIQYSKAGCGSISKSFTINPIPAVPTITYAPGTPNPQRGAPTGGFCVGKVFTVVGTPNVPTGAWSATGFASISSGGVVSVIGTGAGSIKYTYTSAAGCSNSRTMTGTGYTCAARGVSASVDGLVVSDFTMYPNPAKGFINLNVESLVGAGSIVVTDLYGKTLKTQALSMGTNTVDIANLSKGMYFVSTITNQGKTTKKLVVE
jgi:alpha-tubulin suppressor-like RCC1 family protein